MAPECVLDVASESGRGVAEGESVKSRDFLIISYRRNILLLYLAWIAVITIVSADVTTLVIDCWREKSMTWELVVISSK